MPDSVEARITARIARVIERHRMLRFGPRIGVAVSGGADSVFLLDALAALGLAAAVVHINHRLRGAESEADEAFVRDLAARFSLPLSVLAAPVPPGNIEQEARRIRYAHFAALIGNGFCDAVATGHTRDDQAETVLSRFIRGAGTAGLSGILPVTASRVIRPLINTGREEIRAWLREKGRSWQEDCTNLDTGFLRNRIRLEIMPGLERINPSIASTLATTAELAREEENYWSAEIDGLEREYLNPVGETILIDLEEFVELPPSVQRRLLRRGVEKVAGNLRSVDFDHIEAIRCMMATREGSGRLQIPGLDAYRSFDWLRLAPVGIDTRRERDFSVPLRTPGITEVPDRGITVKIETVSGPAVYNKTMDALDRDKCAGTLELRNWRPGDRIQRECDSGPEKIKTLFQEFRVPLWERRNWPVIAGGGSILWTRRFGPDRSVAAGPDSVAVWFIRETGESNRGSAASMKKKRAGGKGAGLSAHPGAEVL